MTERSTSIGYSLPNDEDYALAKLGPALDEAASMGIHYVELALYAIDLVANGRVMPARLVSRSSYQRMWRRQLAAAGLPDDLLWPLPSRHAR